MNPSTWFRPEDLRPGQGQVTIVIPTHNRKAFLGEALDSAMRQGAAVDRVVVVCDGCTDGTQEWLSRYEHPLLTVLEVDPGRGGSAARNQGFKRCTTPYVMFLDDDDVLRAGAIDILVRALAAHPEAAGAAGACARFGATIDRPRTLHPRIRMTRPVWKEVLFNWGLYPSSLLWRSAVVSELGGWSETLGRFEDRDLILRAYPRPFHLVPVTVAGLRFHPGQVTKVPHEELDWRLRSEFAAALPRSDRAIAEAVIESARGFDPAMDAYRLGDFGRARPVILQALSARTTLAKSPILGPWLLGLLAKSTLLGSMPPGWADRLRAHRNGALPVDDAVSQSAA